MRLNSPKINIMLRACMKASKSLIRDFGELEKLQVSKKGPGDFLSAADKKTEKIIIQELMRAYPDYSILSEEIGKIEKNKEDKWIIDPIDGTTNFLHGIPHFAISVALKSQNEITNGLIFDPIKNEMFYAEKNNGAYFNNQRIRVSQKNHIDDCLFGTGGAIDNKIDVQFRKSGSAALDLAYVASGRYDGFCQSNLNLWDIAAGIIIVQEAGGVINDINLDNHKNLNVVASSPNINDKFIKKISNF